MEKFNHIISVVNGWLWGPPLLILLVGTHIYLTVRTGFVQRKLWLGLKLSVTRDKGSVGDITQFGALATALSSTIGTGNIIGVGTAIASGGPGALLWMWLTGVFGIATKYSESLLAVKYRVRNNKKMMIGGAMFVLERGLKMKWLGGLFAAFTALAAFGIGCGVQSKTVATRLFDTFNIANWVSGIIISVMTAFVILGGLKWIARAAQALVPFMSIFYIIGCIVILVINYRFILPAIQLVCANAFNIRSAGGGFLGFAAVKMMTAARHGVARGLFSNESGMGSAPIVAAAAQTKNPVRQALVSSTGTFWDTVVICLLTGLVIISSVLAHPGLKIDGMKGDALTHIAFSQIPMIGNFVLTFGLITFAFSTLLGWSYYGEKGIEYLLGTKSIVLYRLVFVVVAYLGTVLSVDVWNVADVLNALMIIPNLIAVLLLSGVIAAETKKYLNNDHIDDTDDKLVPMRKQLSNGRN